MGKHRSQKRRALLDHRRAFDHWCRDHDIQPLAWIVHFADIEPSEATCLDCADYCAGVCGGGIPPVKCMAGKILSPPEAILMEREAVTPLRATNQGRLSGSQSPALSESGVKTFNDRHV